MCNETPQPEPDGMVDMNEPLDQEMLKTSAANLNDPWAHRGVSMRCASCMWYVRKLSMRINEIGRCRRHAPTMSGYPVVFASDWCGDHKVDETK